MKSYILFLITLCLLSSCSLVQRDTNTFYGHPKYFDVNYQTLYLHTDANQPFHNWWITPKGAESKATILFFHDIKYSKSYYLSENLKLVDSGYNMLTFDYLSQGYSDFTWNIGTTKEGIAALNYLIGEKGLTGQEIIIYAKGSGCYTAIETIRDFGIKPICFILDNPTTSLSSLLLEFNASHNEANQANNIKFENNHKTTPILVYSTESNQNHFEKISDISDLTVRAHLPGNGSQKILYSASIRAEINEFINMSMNPPTQSRSHSE